ARGRAPQSAWTRLAARVERSDACLLLLGQHTEAGTFAAATIRLHRRRQPILTLRPARRVHPRADAPLRPSLLGQVVACAEIVRIKHRVERGPRGVELALEPPNLVARGQP